MEAQVETLPFLAQPKGGYINQSKTNKQTEVPENQTAWNSDNPGTTRELNSQPEQPDQ